MRFPFLRSGKPRHDILLDIGSGSVAAGIVEHAPGASLPALIFAHRERMRLAPQFDEARHLHALREALFAATLTLAEKGLRPLSRERRVREIDDLRVIVSAPWSRTATRTISCADTVPFKITPAFIEDLLEKGDAKAPEHPSMPLHLTRRTLLETRLNGYLVAAAEGQSASEIALTVGVEHVPEVISQAIDDVEKNLTPHRNAEERTHAFALYRTHRALFPGDADALILDITGEASEAAIVRDGVLKDTFVMPRGVHTFVRDLATAMGTIPAEAEAAAKRAPSAGAADDHLARMTETYAGHYRTFLGAIREHHTIPARVFVAADLAFAPLARGILARVFADMKNCHVTELDGALLGNIVRFEPGAEDAMLGVAAAFFHTGAGRAAGGKK